MTAFRTSTVTKLAGVPLVVSRTREGKRVWRVRQEPARANDVLPFRDVLSLGTLGVGSSVPLVRGQCDYYENIDTTQFDSISPGDLVRRFGYSFDYPVTAIDNTYGVKETTALKSPNTVDAANGSGTATWTNPENVKVSDNLYATVNVNAQQSAFLDTTNVAWVPNAPSGSDPVINVVITVRALASVLGVVRLFAQLIVDGVRTGSIKSTSFLPSTAQDIVITFSNPGLNASQAGASNFGVSLWTNSGSSVSSVTVSIDSVYFYVEYSNDPTREISTRSGYVSSSVNGGGGVNWSNPGNATGAPNSSYASVNLTPASSKELRMTSFNLGANGNVVNITVNVECRVSSTTNPTRLRCQLINNGVPFGDIQLIEITSTTDTVHSVTFMGLFLSSSVVNASAFGVYLIATSESTTSVTVSIDHVAMSATSSVNSPIVFIGAGNTLRVLIPSSTLGSFSLNEIGNLVYPTAFVSSIICIRRGDVNETPVALVGFGRSSPIQQIDSISINGVMTASFSSGANAVYADQFWRAANQLNTEQRIWRSLYSGGVSSAIGAVNRIQSLKVTATTDAKNSANWEPVVPYTLSDTFAEITAGGEFERGMFVATTTGLYLFDQNANSYNAFSTYTYQNIENGKSTITAGDRIFYPTIRDLIVYPPIDAFSVIGITRLLSNTSGKLQGYPTAVAALGDDRFVAYYDGIDSVIVRLRLPRVGSVPHPYIIDPLHRVPSYKICAMKAVIGERQEACLFFSYPSQISGKHDLGYIVLGPEYLRLFQSGGFLRTSIYGSLERRSTIERVSFYTLGCNAQATWQVAIAFDEAIGTTYTNLGAPVTTNGYQTRDVSMSGYRYQLQFSCSIADPSQRPRLLGNVVFEEGVIGGVSVEGVRQAATVEVIEFVSKIGQDQEMGYGVRRRSSAQSAYQTLSSLAGTGTLVDLIDVDHFHDDQPRKVYIDVIGYESDTQQSPNEADRLVQIRLRRPIS